MSRIGADPTWKAGWRLVRQWICHNHKIYYTYSIGCAFLVYQFWWYSMVGYYKQRNHHRSLEFAQKTEAEWEINKPKEEEYDDEEESEGDEPEAAAAGGAEPDSEAEEDE